MTTAILLSTYNGAAWLPQQLASLAAQSDLDWTLYLRDDGSQDETLALLAARQSPRVKLLSGPPERLGACQSFGRLLQDVQADDYLFCDQDDYWQPHKVARLRAALRALEARYGAETPILLHSDLRVAGPDLALLHPSFWRYQGFDPQAGAALNRLLLQNVVTGCASICNRALRDLATPLPPQALMHDWWLALVAAAFGRLEALPEALLDYRQHAGNAVGASRLGLAYIRRRFFQPDDIRHRLADTRRQAAAFAARYAGQLTPAQAAIIQGYARLDELSWPERRRFLWQHQILKHGFARNLGLFLWV